MTDGPVKKAVVPLFGTLAVKNRLITDADLETGLDRCKDASDLEEALRSYFLSEELISKKNIQRLAVAAKAISIRQKEFKFGAIAVSKGFINKSVLELALEDQEDDLKQGKKPRRIGDMMVEAGLITESQRDMILKMQNRKPKPGNGDNGDQNGSRDASAAEKKEGAPEKEAVKPDPPELLPPELIIGGIQLQVAGDLMAAFLTKTPEFDPDVPAQAIREALIDRGIVSGLAADELIEGFVRSSGFKTQSFRVAKGIRPIEGKDAKVEFFFNTDYLKAGGMDEEGNIDFKQRGEVPLVEKGTVLAEKTPRVEERPGLNLYGEDVHMVPSKDKPLKFGKGALLSEDGFKLLAGVRGYPKYSLGGVVFVHEEYTTGGDVDYETGHIEFDGKVNVKGCIKSGFKVRGSDITAIELDGGIVEADGDLKVAGGINEGKIYARGNVYAKFILSSEIICMGDVYVEKEIVDSTIDAGGACSIIRGKLISSKVSAKMGLAAQNIGTEMGAPSVIKVGYDAFTARELAQNKSKTAETKEEILKLEGKKAESGAKKDALQQDISKLAHVQDRSQLEQAEIRKQMNDPAGAAVRRELEKKLEALETSAREAEESIDRCFTKIDAADALIKKIDREIHRFETLLENLTEERNNLTRWSRDNPGKPQVLVEGALLSGNRIMGKHSDLTVDTMIRHARITEVLAQSDDESGGRPAYRMKVDNY
ncbi:MAG: DUF342 domain-containing protein [Desulfobacter sp.]|nr:MAG: DUF342 domain-containing protein [Desulfobacter sp.]